MSPMELHDQVRAAYTEIAISPGENHLFPCGRRLAENLEYPPELLDNLPAGCVEAFCGVGNVSLYADIQPSNVVLDAGCGGGMDTLVAAGRAARVIGVDFSLRMLQRAQHCIEASGLAGKVTLLKAEMQDLPLMDASVDVALVNGLFNLNPFREQAFRELARVVRPGGALYASELILTEPPKTHEAGNWFS